MERLPSWRDSDARDAILRFVDRVTDPASPDFVSVEKRIAVFDNDGTLLAEQPIYIQTLYSIERLRDRLLAEPELAREQPFAGARDGDFAAISATGIPGHLRLFGEATAGMSFEELERDVRAWFKSARHPETGVMLSSLVYQPMLEVLSLLRQHQFQCWLITGSSVDFLRIFAPLLYDIPAERIAGSELTLSTRHGADALELVRGSECSLINDGPEKVISIMRHIGGRPIAAFGNSDGDVPMLEWVAAGNGPRLSMLIHHTDAVREWAYDRDSDIGRLSRGLDLDADGRFLRADMACDWARIFPA